MHKNLDKVLRVFLNLLAVYLVVDGTIHILNIRLQSVADIWPASALSYATLLNAIYASFVFLAAILVLVALSDLKKYKSLVLASSIWSVFHGLLLIYLNSSQNFMDNFSSLPSLHVWMPFYNYYLFFESLLSLIYAGLVFIWIKN